MKTRIFILLAIIISVNAIGQLKTAVPHPIQIYRGDGIISLVYELHMADSLRRPVNFIDFTISSGETILLKDSEFAQLPKKKDTNRYVKYIWINVNQIPKSVNHIIKYKIDNYIYNLTKVIDIKEEPIISIGLPVKGGHWLMFDGPSPKNSHRNHTTPLKARYDSIQDGYKLGYSNQRLAIDFEKVGENGKLYKNDGYRNEDHFCYGEKVYAVAGGVVIGVVDSIPCMPNPTIIEEFENKTDFTGNLVLQDIGDGVVASYAHLLNYSITVNVGDTIKKGDFIGKIGNSGNSTAPHLHFHLSKPDYSLVKTNDIIGMFIVSEGVSFVFDKYIKHEVKSGKIIDYEGVTEFYSEPFILGNSKIVYNAMPYDKEIIEIVE